MWSSAVTVLLLISSVLGSEILDNSIYRSSSNFTVDFGKLTFNKYIKGGSGGVYVVSGSNHTYTLKFSLEIDHFQEEVLADKLYTVLGVDVPRFLVLSNYSSLPTDIQVILHNAPFVRVAEFIHRTETVPENFSEALNTHYANNFVIDAFLANRDGVKKDNCLYSTNNKFYRIDNGGSMRNRSIGKRKKGSKRSDMWDALLIPELKSLVKYNPSVYSHITEETIATQAENIVAKGRALMEAFQELSSALKIDPVNHDSLMEMLLARLQVLQMLLHPGVSYPARPGRPVSALAAAGFCLICTINSTQHVLLGSRKSLLVHSDHHWVALGGGRVEYGIDRSLAETASRELFEETMGLMARVNIGNDAPFHDLIHEDHLFRQYFYRVETETCIDANALDAAEPPLLPNSDLLGIKEFHHFRWFPLSVVRNITSNGTIGTTTERVFPSFAELLHIPRVQSLLRAFDTNTPLPGVLHAQSMPKRGDVGEKMGEFLPFNK